MSNEHYIGINGLGKSDITPTVMTLSEAGVLGAGPSICFGVQASTTTQIKNRENRYGNEWYPVGSDIGDWFRELHGTTIHEGIVHINTDTPDTYALLAMCRLIAERSVHVRIELSSASGEVSCRYIRGVDGYQLNNLDWVGTDYTPLVQDLRQNDIPHTGHHDNKIILQANATLLQTYTPNQIASTARRYTETGARIVILLDGSGGKGVRLNQAFLRDYCEALYRYSIPFGIAGGLNGDTIEELAGGLMRDYPVSVDAESGLRDWEGRNNPASSQFSPQKAAFFALKAIELYKD